MSTSSWPLQAALYVRLVGWSGLKPLIGDPPRVYDDVPREAVFPYVVLGPAQWRDAAAAEVEMAEHVLSLSVWSRAGGGREARAVLAVLHGALHEQTLALDGHALVNLRCVTSEVSRESDGETYRGLLRLRAVTEPL